MPYLVDLPNPGIKTGSPKLQVDSLPTELSGELLYERKLNLHIISASPPPFLPSFISHLSSIYCVPSSRDT